MPFFRRAPDIRRAVLRPTAAADLTAVSRLLRDGRYRLSAYEPGLLPGLVAAAPGVVLVAEDQGLLGLVVLSQPYAGVSWIRAAALASGTEAATVLGRLLPALEVQARAAGAVRLYHSGDPIADSWLHGPLLAHGYQPNNEVVVYEKVRMDVPSQQGAALIRRATAADLAVVLQVDAASFAPQWVKDDTLIAAALRTTPFFLVAELAGAIVGYAFATSHFDGRLVHLVRLAVTPQARGQGAGTQLLAAVVAFARGGGATALTLNTQADNDTAQRLYERFGFRRTGEHQTVLLRELGDSPVVHPA